jgi:putative aminopeptidase FrvX
MELLKRLTETAGIAGREHRVRDLIQSEIKGLFDSTRVDAMGSLIGVKKPTTKSKKRPKPVKIMLAAHMDQIGFMVRHIDKDGFLRLNPVGGFDPRNLFARLVTVCTEGGDLMGVLNPGGRPLHIATEEDKKRIPKVGDFIVDLGLSGDEVSKRVKIGDMVVLKAETHQIGKMVVGQCLDNRVACWIAIRALQKLKRHSAEVHCAFTVQEEVGLRGAGTAAYSIQPDIGVAIDTTLCVDTPGVPTEERVTAHGEGAALTCMDSSFVSDLDVLSRFQKVATKKKIPHQRSILPRGGTDSGAIQRSAGGVKVMTLSCPTRYIHTVTEAVHTGDLNACRDLLAAFLEDF